MNYLKLGINVIAVDNNKRAIMPWKKYQTERITPEELAAQQANPKAFGIAVICGAISGNLGILDIDAKYDLTGNLMIDFMQSLPDELKAKMYIVTTKNGGYHLYYRCKVLSGNQKLAQRYTTEDERKENPNDKIRVLIETREEGGYAVAPPTPGYNVPDGAVIPEFTPEERESIFECARSFNQVFNEVQPVRNGGAESFSISPFDDYNKRGEDDMISRLTNAGWQVVRADSKKVVFLRPGKTDSKSSGDYNYEKNWFCVFTTSTEFEPLKAYKPAAVFCKLECNDNWQECARRLVELGYGEQRRQIGGQIKRDIFKKKESGQNDDDIAYYIKQKHGLPNLTEALDLVQQCTTQWGERICTFWEVTDKGGITIIRHKLLEFLSKNGGYYLYYYDKKSTIFKVVRVQDGFVEEASTEHLKKFIDSYIMGLPNSFDGITPNQLLEAIYKGANTYFSASLLEFMQRIELNLLKDTHNEAFFPFKNGVLKVTADKKELLTYGALNCHVWKNRVIDFRVDPDEAIDWHQVEFVRFLKKICADDTERLIYVVQIIGYILHGYKDATRPFAVILAEESEKEKEGGGTGKGIFFKAISKMLDVVFVDGKNFKLDKSFAFQRVELSTQLIVIEDCRKNVDFEGFYSHLTEGITVEKKNKDELYIPYADAAKFGFTTNYTINLKGNHGKRRGKVIEFSNFFHPKNTPLDFFGHQLFDGWDQDEWNRFFNMMAECVQAYLKEGISDQYNSDSMKRKAVKLNFGEEFFEYFEEIKVDQWQFITDEYLSFLNTAGIEKKDYSLKRFKAGLESSCDVMGYTLEERKNRQAENKKEFRIL
jgi:hypothetical protein